MANNSPIPDPESLIPLIKLALAEDIGPGDITSKLLIPAEKQAVMAFVARENMVACGTFVPELVYGALGSGIKTEAKAQEGALLKKGEVLATASGSLQTLLTGERVTLNIMQRMCGVATIARQYVEAVKGTKAVILDTRKTMPGMRVADKYAVKTGGGQNHRMGLWDMVLIKDNHIGMGDSGFGIMDLIIKARNSLTQIPHPESPIPIVVECDTLEQVKEAIAAKPDRILLDNMSNAMLKEAVAMSAGKIPLEASGGVSLETVRDIAQTGVDFISVGKLTHSAPNVDIGADIT